MLVTVTADDTLHLWNFQKKIPAVVHCLKFQRERYGNGINSIAVYIWNRTIFFLILFNVLSITCIHLPVGSKWLYVGTEKGNIHIVHTDSFTLSGYIIHWNKAVELWVYYCLLIIHSDDNFVCSMHVSCMTHFSLRLFYKFSDSLYIWNFLIGIWWVVI